MGIDAFVWCQDCDMREGIGRAYRYKDDVMNKRLDKLHIQHLLLTQKRLYESLQKTIYSEHSAISWDEEFIAFLQEHEEHKLWLINDFFDEEKTDGRVPDMRERVQAV
jgi:L-lactate utilization protein LutC